MEIFGVTNASGGFGFTLSHWNTVLHDPVFVSSFSEEPVSEEFIGTYLLAHELGHAILKIPDVYDHGPGCLMNTSFAPSYTDGYAALQSTHGKFALSLFL